MDLDDLAGMWSADGLAVAGVVLGVGVLFAMAVWLGSEEGVVEEFGALGECLSAAGKSLFQRAHALVLKGMRGRSREIGMGEVAEMVDIVRLGLSAGLSFDASLALYCEGRSGPLAGSLEEALFCWQVGLTSRDEALARVARETGVHALGSFASVVSQALELGAPLAETLETQSHEMRTAHRAHVEREIERAPVKLLIPTGTLILPALLLSIVGPLLAAADMV